MSEKQACQGAIWCCLVSACADPFCRPNKRSRCRPLRKRCIFTRISTMKGRTGHLNCQSRFQDAPSTRPYPFSLSNWKRYRIVPLGLLASIGTFELDVAKIIAGASCKRRQRSWAPAAALTCAWKGSKRSSSSSWDRLQIWNDLSARMDRMREVEKWETNVTLPIPIQSKMLSLSICRR